MSLKYRSGPSDFPWASLTSFGVTLAPFGSLWGALGLPLAPLGWLLGVFGVPLGTLWLPLGVL